MLEHNPDLKVDDRSYLCYLIALGGNLTYVGVTNNFSRRIRQHNGVIKGGAKYTTGKGDMWVPIIHVTGFPSYRSALQFEWKWKNLTSRLRYSNERQSIANRLLALDRLLSLTKVTKKSIADDFRNLSVKWQTGATYCDMLIFHTKRPCLVKLRPKSS